ncbi:hypothetical protein AB0I51_37210 [Streptomyces sp. NPDC050549]|uniref:hypothetical protein n=1 Tax=Streptomyces sp. NPDC050549 TaxID=3155406 RepID=UPI003446E623
MTGLGPWHLGVLVGPLAVLLCASTIVMFDPDMMITGDDQDGYRAAPASHATDSS